jgi:DDE superfamily endonuclease
MPCLPEAIILVLAPFALPFSQRSWRHAQVLLLGAIVTPGARTVTAALRAMGLSGERHFTNYHRVLNRATWSARQASRILLECSSPAWCPRARLLCWELMTRWNVAVAGRARPKVAIAMRCAPRRNMLSAALA